MNLDVQKYLKISSIDGLLYISKRFQFAERIFWTISLTFSVVCTSIFIGKVVIKVQNFPIVAYLSDQAVPLSEINFPAVTVCPQFQPFLDKDTRKRGGTNKYYRFENHNLELLFYEDAEYLRETEDEQKIGNFSYFELLGKIVNFGLNPDKLGIKLLKRLQVIDLLANKGTFQKLNFSIPTDEFLDVINEFPKAFKDTFSLVFYWIDQYQWYMSEILTEWGLCFTYNIAFSHDLLDLNSTSGDFHYQHSHREIFIGNLQRLPKNLPKRISTGKSGLWVGFGDILYKKDVILNDFNGYVVILHDPFELPTKRSKIINFNIKLQTKILIDPLINTIDESLVEYKSNERNCYLKHEKILKFFKVYTKNNCENECLTDFMLSRCGCVEFFMIRNSTTRICSANEQNCYNEAKEAFEIQKGVCGCLLPCDFVKYSFEIIEYGVGEKKGLSRELEFGFKVHYKNSVFNQLIHKKQFNELDFLSFVGGILGLFAGFSALSFVELIYWFTVRVFIKNCKTGYIRSFPIDENDEKKNLKISKILDFFTSYFNESSVHGLKHIFESSKVGSVFWTFFILCAMTLCIHMILSAREKVPDSRVVAYDDNYKSVEDIPFPAITFVPPYAIPDEMMTPLWMYVAYRMSKGVAISDMYLADPTTREHFERDLTVFFFCTEKYKGYEHGHNFSFIPHLLSVLRANDESTWFRQQFSAFNGKYQPEFAEIRTSRGMGFTFNMIEADEMFNFDQISQDFNYTRNITTSPQNLQKIPNAHNYPLTFNKTDKTWFTLKLNKNHDGSKPCLMQSFFIHELDYLPTFNARTDFANFDYGTTVDVVVTPEIIRTEGLKHLKPSERECYFEGEKSLKFFKKYSQKHCEVECIANITMNRCNCADISQPFRHLKDICLNISRLLDYCFTHFKHDLFESENFSAERSCSCLPSCDSVSYNIQYFTKNSANGGQAILNVRMNMDDIVLFRRYQQFTFSDVVSYVGGLLGLFAGISMLSIVEFFYFFTIRLGINLWRIWKGKSVT